MPAPLPITTTELIKRVAVYLDSSEALEPSEIAELRELTLELNNRNLARWAEAGDASSFPRPRGEQIVRTYDHVASDGTVTQIHVTRDGDRHYFSHGRKLILPTMPTAVAGRYTAERIANGDYTPQQIHDDYMLEGAYQPPVPATPEASYIAQADEIVDTILAGRVFRTDRHERLVLSEDELKSFLRAAARAGILTERSN